MIQGFCWHVHHDVLFEYCYDYDERVAFIKEYKSKNERPLRLKLLKLIKGQLPEEIVKTSEAYRKARGE